jgi:hypothetical protein
MLREYRADDVVACLPDDLHKFVGPRTRVVAVSTHNPLGVTFAAGVYTSIFGSSRMPINSHYSRELFAAIKGNPFRTNFKVIVGGSGGWQIVQTDTYEELSIDCVVEGRSESTDTLDLFAKRFRRRITAPRRVSIRSIAKAFCFRYTNYVWRRRDDHWLGRRCKFCVPI